MSTIKKLIGNAMKNKILIVEDHNLLRRGLRAMIEDLSDYEVVGEVVDGKDAIRSALLLRPDLILMDLSLPGMNGLEATTQIKRRLPSIKILVLTVFNCDEYVNEALRVGADGYILKDVSCNDLITAMHTIICGKRYICSDVSMHLINDYIQRGDLPRQQSAWSKLTGRERSVLKLVAEGRTNRMAGEFLSISEKTVEKHRANLMHKLGLRNASELVLMALDMGLIEHEGKTSSLITNSRIN